MPAKASRKTTKPKARKAASATRRKKRDLLGRHTVVVKANDRFKKAVARVTAEQKKVADARKKVLRMKSAVTQRALQKARQRLQTVKGAVVAARKHVAVSRVQAQMARAQEIATENIQAHRQRLQRQSKAVRFKAVENFLKKWDVTRGKDIEKKIRLRISKEGRKVKTVERRAKAQLKQLAMAGGTRKRSSGRKAVASPVAAVKPTAKRGPGRPAGAKSTAKRGPGRPAGAKSQAKRGPGRSPAVKSTAKRGPGRPAGAKSQAKRGPVKSTAKRGPGRPAGAKSQAKRGPGRPRGS